MFGGFSGAACGGRIADSGSRVLVTMDGYYRNGELIDHKAKADEAIAVAAEQGAAVDKVLVWRRHPGEYASKSAMVEGRDFFIDELMADFRGRVVDPVSMPAEAPLFLMYTSGTTGRPKGCQHSTGGYLSYVTGTSKYYQDIHPSDTYWCFADIGWITGHSYIVYGPLSLGTTSVMYEGVPLYPDPGRPWRIAERLGVSIFHTAPTTTGCCASSARRPKKYDYHFKHMTTVGEPIEPDVWRWYYEVVGKREAAIVDTWWQTENGGFLGSTLPALQPMKPGSCGPGVLGIYPVIYDEDGAVVEAGSGKAGNICIRNPWPGIFQTIWGQPDRFVKTYYERYCTTRTAPTGTTGPTSLATGRCRRPMATSASSAVSMMSSTSPGTGSAPRNSNRRPSPSTRSPKRQRCPLSTSCAGAPWRCMSRSSPVRRPARTSSTRSRKRSNRDREDRASQECLDRPRHAEDPVGQDHAPGDRIDIELRRRRRRHHARQPRDRRPNPAPSAEREAVPWRDAAAAHQAGGGRDQGVRASRVTLRRVGGRCRRGRG